MKAPGYVEAICSRLQEAGHKAYIVGGAVRDMILGVEPNDWDITTDALPDQVGQLFKRIVPTGKRFGTVTVIEEGKYEVEVTTFRKDGIYFDGRRPDKVEFTDDLIADLARRDFTVNAMAYDPTEDKLIDPFSGRIDLGARTVCAVGEARERFIEDPLRMLRAIRFVSKRGWYIAPQVGEAIESLHCLVDRVSVERITDELTKILMSENPALRLMAGIGLLQHISPLHVLMYGCKQNHWHVYDVWNHTVETVKGVCGGSLVLMHAAFFHDIAKPLTKTEVDGQIHFYGHEEAGAQIAREELTRLHFPGQVVDGVEILIREHMFDRKMGKPGIRRLIRRAGEWFPDLIKLGRADYLATNPVRDMKDFELFEVYVAEIQAVKEDKITLTINGDDIMETTGLPQGKEIGRILHLLTDIVLDDPIQNTRENLLRLVKEVI